jgi:hypothetical protein
MESRTTKTGTGTDTDGGADVEGAVRDDGTAAADDGGAAMDDDGTAAGARDGPVELASTYRARTLAVSESEPESSVSSVDGRRNRTDRCVAMTSVRRENERKRTAIER